MNNLTRTLLVLSVILVSAISADSQENECGVPYVFGVNCSGNNCSQYITLIRPSSGSNSTCLVPYMVYCCNTQYEDFNDSGFYCSFVCDDAVKAILKDPDASEFSMTHTLWAKDCSGHYRPFSRSWDVTRKLIDLRPPRLGVSGIGG